MTKIYIQTHNFMTSILVTIPLSDYKRKETQITIKRKPVLGSKIWNLSEVGIWTVTSTKMDKSLFQLLEFVGSVSHLLGQVPYKWDLETQQLRTATSIQWKITQILLPVHLIYVCTRFWSSMFSESFLIAVPLGLHAFSTIFHYIFHVTYIIFCQDFLNCTNKYLYFLKEMSRKFFLV